MKQVIAAVALGLGGLSLSACGGEADTTVAEDTGIPGMSVENARMVLAPVAGNPAAVYFDLTYTGDKALALRKANVEQAGETMMHEFGEYDFKVQMMEMLPLVINSGDTVKFEPNSRHVMAMDVQEDLAPGDKVNVTLTVAGGKEFSFLADVRAAGEDR
ncbi:copper chaperone PCu(A)C [Parerythrobacter jejuensis]|uniref:Copper chaperone PCu(A)C n=1 Tax=Parerythrobacter jejuensis TaxID=795812 RepID=A0A845ANF7_9SPHN|nr:copper chaperone PCu(A)C [Parerythrobacter jejuensis]MXP32352.1 copper chaperone PCu(A)C [Parerythrobacter jejuensis]